MKSMIDSGKLKVEPNLLDKYMQLRLDKLMETLQSKPVVKSKLFSEEDVSSGMNVFS